MPQEKIIWAYRKTPEVWHKKASAGSSGIVDERYIKDYIASQKEVKVVSLGIGTGRELNWLKQLKNIKEVIGIDYSQAMLDFCRKTAKEFPVKVSLIKENLLSLKKLEVQIKNEKLALIYIYLLNTLGNLEEKNRIRVLKKINALMKKEDRLILALYKRPERIREKVFLPDHIKLKLKENSGLKIKFGEVIEYMYYEVWWPPILEKYHQLPRFWYNDKTNDITIYAGKRKVFISHRFSEEEIMEMAKEAKLKIEKLIEGKFMWVVILRV